MDDVVIPHLAFENPNIKQGDEHRLQAFIEHVPMRSVGSNHII